MGRARLWQRGGACGLGRVVDGRRRRNGAVGGGVVGLYRGGTVAGSVRAGQARGARAGGGGAGAARVTRGGWAAGAGLGVEGGAGRVGIGHGGEDAAGREGGAGTKGEGLMKEQESGGVERSRREEVGIRDDFGVEGRNGSGRVSSGKWVSRGQTGRWRHV